MRQQLDYYIASLDRWPFEVGVDLSVASRAPIAGMPYRAHVRFELNHPTEDGLATQEEAALLGEIEDRILGNLGRDEHCFVAHVTHRNARTMVLYTKTRPEGEHDVLKLLRGVETHSTRVMFEEDPEWTEYREFLYPAPRFLHQIKDRRVLQEFERQGDDCSRVRPIEPVFGGLDEERAKALARDLQEAGFSVKQIGEAGSNGQREWKVIGAVESPLALGILDDFREVWMSLAKKFGGRYDGWTAEVVPCNSSEPSPSK